MRAFAAAFYALVALWNAAAASPTSAAEPATPDPAANDVCSYVAAAYNRGQ